MPTSVRLDEKTETLIAAMVARTGRTKSQILREAVARLAEQEDLASSPSLFERMADLVGIAKGGRPIWHAVPERLLEPS